MIKRNLCMLLAAVILLCCLSACSAGTKAYTCQGLTMTIPSNLRDVSSNSDFSSFTFALDSKKMAVFGLNEKSADLGVELTLKEYAELVMEANDFEGFPVQSATYGYYYFRYNKTLDQGAYRFLAAVYEADDGFWLIQIAAPILEYDETAFFKYLDSVSVR